MNIGAFHIVVGIPIVIGAAIVLALFLSVYLVLRYIHGRKKQTIVKLLKAYFQGEISADELKTRIHPVAGRRFAQGAEFYALVVAAFQCAVDPKTAQKPPSKEHEKKMMSLLAALKTQFGLADLYRIEGWRAGRE